MKSADGPVQGLPSAAPRLSARLAAEGLGTALLLAAVVGSGIMAERLAGGNVAVALLANTLATVATLFALIVTLGPVSGAHFNPAVTLALALRGALDRRAASAYVAVQLGGALLGVVTAHAMFGLEPLSASQHARGGLPLVLSEAVATCGLVLVVLCDRRGGAVVAAAVACWIAGAYWFTASTCFANPAVTLARSLSDTFTGIRPADVPGFLAGQLAGTGLALVLAALLAGSRRSR
jgi:glycerol uptake facilitator-like aquaporin